jgi:hypothetical protein
LDTERKNEPDTDIDHSFDRARQMALLPPELEVKL